MADLNSVTVIGRITRDLDDKSYAVSANGTARAKVSIAVNRSEPYFTVFPYGLNLLGPITDKHILFVRIVAIIGCWQTLHPPEVANLVATFEAFYVFPNLFHSQLHLGVVLKECLTHKFDGWVVVVLVANNPHQLPCAFDES